MTFGIDLQNSLRIAVRIKPHLLSAWRFDGTQIALFQGGTEISFV